MGLNQGGSSNRTYLSISNGKIAKRVPEGTAGAIKCNSKDGTKVFEDAGHPKNSKKEMETYMIGEYVEPR